MRRTVGPPQIGVRRRRVPRCFLKKRAQRGPRHTDAVQRVLLFYGVGVVWFERIMMRIDKWHKCVYRQLLARVHGTCAWAWLYACA